MGDALAVSLLLGNQPVANILPFPAGEKVITP